MTEKLDITNKEQLFKLTNLNDWRDNPFFDNAQTIAIYLYGEQGMEMPKLERAFMAGTIIATKDIQSQLTEKDKKIEELKEEVKLEKIENKDLIERVNELEAQNNQLTLKLDALEGETPWKDIKDKSELIKRNVELQHKVDTLQGFLDRDVEFDNLQKENTELKDEQKELLKDTAIYDSLLTKAKELLTRFVMASVYFNGKEADLVKETEQFLSEVSE